MLNDTVRRLINKYSDLIEANQWLEAYDNILREVRDSEVHLGNFTDTLLDAGVDPFIYMDNIPQSAFFGSAIPKYTIPDNVTTIRPYAFEDCSKLTSINIPDSVTSIKDYAFYYCSSLTKVNYLGTIDQWVQINFDDEGANPLFYAENLYINGSLITKATIPAATKISSYAFFNCRSLTGVTIGSNVESIGEFAFSNCSLLPDVTIPNNVTGIGEGAFQNCSSLTNITISNSVTSIERNTFEDCISLESITIPNSVKSIGGYTFWGCNSLVNIEYKGTTTQWKAVSKGYDWKYNVPESCTVHCTDGDLKI